jgi:hypothetical protein
MTELLLAVFGIINLILTVVVIRLVILCRQLSRGLSSLEEKVGRNSKDIAGLCSAAVRVDDSIQQQAHYINEIAGKISELEQLEAGGYVSSPYQNVISRIHQGATVEQLVKDCGISQEEATLLIRLHGDPDLGNS